MFILLHYKSIPHSTKLACLLELQNLWKIIKYPEKNWVPNLHNFPKSAIKRTFLVSF